MAIWGTDCGRVKLSGKMITKVLAKNGQESKLYKDILTLVDELPKENVEELRESFRDWEGKHVGDVDNKKHLALALYAKTNSPNFKNEFKGERDENDEPASKPALDILLKKAPQQIDEDNVQRETPAPGTLEERKAYLEANGATVLDDGSGTLKISVDPKSTFFQTEGREGTRASQVTVDTWKTWYKNNGVDYEIATKGIKDSQGRFIDANESVDVQNKIVRVLDGKEDVAIGEAGMHIVTSIVKQKNPGLFKQLMNGIGSFKIYEQVVADYKDRKEYQLPDGKPDILKLKEEAIGKILHAYYNEEMDGSTEMTSKDLEKVQTWWTKIKDYLRDFFKGNPFTKVVEEFKKGEYDVENIQETVNKLQDLKDGQDFGEFRESTVENFKQVAKTLPDKSVIVTHGTVVSLLKSWKEAGYSDDTMLRDSFDKQTIDNGHIEEINFDGKTIYLVRHGESEANAKDIESTPETPLTGKGEDDALKVAQELKEKGISQIVSTDTERTKGTAEILREKLGINNIFFQATKQEGEKNFEKLTDLLDKVEDNQGNSFYKVKANGEKVPNRVTDLSHKFLEKIFKNKDWLKDKIVAAINDLKKAFGIKNHGHIEHIMERAFDKKTGLRKDTVDPIDPKRFTDDDDRFFYNKLENYLLGYTSPEGVKIDGLVDQFPVGTRFLWEKKIYDPNRTIDGKKGLAGTVDWMAIEPSGKTHLYDWKFIGSLEKNESIRNYMQQAYNIQMENYVDILAKQYGIKDIGNVRIVPISVKYGTLKGQEGKALSMLIGSTDYKNEKTDYLLPYVTSSEKTGDKKLDDLIKRLTGLLKQTQSTAVSEKEQEIKNTKVKSLMKAIQMIQLTRSFELMLDSAELFNTDIAKKREVLKNTLDTTDFNNIKSAADFDKMVEPIVEALNDLKVYTNLTDFIDYFDKSSEEGKLLNERIAKVKESAEVNYKKLEDLNAQYWDQWGKLRNIHDLIEPQKKLEVIGAEGRTLSKTQLATGQAFYDINNQKQNIVDIESNEMLTDIEKINDRLGEWGKRLGLSKAATIKKFQSMLEQKDSKGKGTNKLISKYDKSFTTELTKHIEAGDLEWVKQNIDIAKFEEWAKNYHEEQMEVIKNLSIPGSNAEQERQLKIDTLNRKTDLTGKYAWTQVDILKRFARTDDKINWYSKEYREVLKNQPVKDFYDFIIKWNQEAAKCGYIEHYQKENFLPFVEKSLTEKLGLGGKWSIKDKILEALSEPSSKGLSERRDPVSGELIPVLPKYFTTDLSFEKDGEKVYEGISDDLVKNMGMFVHKVIDYRAKVEVENTIEALMYLEKYKGMLESDTKGKLTGEIMKNMTNFKYLEDAIMTHFYGKSILSGGDIKGKKITVEGKERELSAMKASNALKAAYSFNVLGFNFTTSIFRAISTNVSGLINAGTHYSQKEMMSSFYDFCSMRTVKNNHKLTIALMKDFMPVEENMQEALHHLTANKVTALDFQEVMMKWVKSAHNIVQYTNYFSHMKNAVVIDGKLMNAREYLKKTPEYANRYKLSAADRAKLEKSIESKVKTLIDKHGLLNNVEFDEKTGKVNYKNLDMKDFSVADFKSLIRVTGRQLSGNISENDQSHIRSNALVRQMFLFTNWLPQAIDMRFGELAYSQGKQAYEYGRTRMMFRILWGEGILPRVGKLMNMYRATDKGVEALSKMYQEHLEEYRNRTGQELNMTEAEFNDMVRQNIKIQARELAMMLTFATMAYGLSALLPSKEEDPEDQGYFTFMKRVTNRCKDELELFYDPRKFAEFGSGSKIPVLGYLADLGKVGGAITKEAYGYATGDQEIKDPHTLMHMMHAAPISRQVLDVLSIVDPEMTKELGYHYNAEIITGK